MRINAQKWRRREQRRAAGNRAVREPEPRASGPVYLMAHACFRCRKSFKVPPRAEGSARCPQCGGDLYAMGRSFKAPPRRSIEQWRKVQSLYAHGFRFFSYRSYPGAPRLPERFREVAAFVASHPVHPFRIARPNSALQPTVHAPAARPR